LAVLSAATSCHSSGNLGQHHQCARVRADRVSSREPLRSSQDGHRSGSLRSPHPTRAHIQIHGQCGRGDSSSSVVAPYLRSRQLENRCIDVGLQVFELFPKPLLFRLHFPHDFFCYSSLHETLRLSEVGLHDAFYRADMNVFCFSWNWTSPQNRLAYDRDGGVAQFQLEQNSTEK
jgi:hypothetical protein